MPRCWTANSSNCGVKFLLVWLSATITWIKTNPNPASFRIFSNSFYKEKTNIQECIYQKEWGENLPKYQEMKPFLKKVGNVKKTAKKFVEVKMVRVKNVGWKCLPRTFAWCWTSNENGLIIHNERHVFVCRPTLARLTTWTCSYQTIKLEKLLNITILRLKIKNFYKKNELL